MNKGNKRRSKRMADKRNPRDYRDSERSSNTRDERVEAARNSFNDISWYSRNPNLLLAAGSFPYPYRPGMSIPLGSITYPTGKLGTQPLQETIPGVLVMNWIPSFGNSKHSTDPASVAGKEIYGRVRAAYSGPLDADAPDYIIYIGALDSIFAYLGWLKRLYRTISSYTPENFMFPDGLLRAMGFPESYATQLRTRKMKLWQGINELILQSRKFKCPAVMDLFNRHYWMSDNVYTDAPSPRGQIFLFNLDGVWKIGDVQEQSSGDTIKGLVMQTMDFAPTQNEDIVDVLIKFGRDLIEALDAWDDGYTISGYLQRAFADVPSFAVAELLQQELLEAQYVPEVLTQIENARELWTLDLTTAGIRNMYQQLYVTQNVQTNSVVTNMDMVYERPSERTLALLAMTPDGVSPMLSLRTDTPTVADTTIATRLHAVTEVTAADGKLTFHSQHGTELITYMRMAYMYNGSSTKSWTVIDVHQICLMNIEWKAGEDYTDAYFLSTLTLEQFDWHPFIYAIGTPANQLFPALAICGDIHNATTVTPEQLENLHKICLYSEFNSFGI